MEGMGRFTHRVALRHSSQCPCGGGGRCAHREMPEILRLNLRLPVPTTMDHDPWDGEADRAGVGDKGLGLEMTLKAWQLPPSVWGGPQEAPTRGTSLLGVSQVSVNGRGGGWASPNPARTITALPSTSSHASSRGWHPRSAARHLLPERKGPSPQPPWQHEPARVPERHASRNRAPFPGCGPSGGGPSRPPAPPSSVSGRRGLSLPPGFALGAVSPGDHLSATHPLGLHFLDSQGPGCFCVWGQGRFCKDRGQGGLDQEERPARWR